MDRKGEVASSWLTLGSQYKNPSSMSHQVYSFRADSNFYSATAEKQGVKVKINGTYAQDRTTAPNNKPSDRSFVSGTMTSLRGGVRC